jgi:hypothetical protein
VIAPGATSDWGFRVYICRYRLRSCDYTRIQTKGIT